MSETLGAKGVVPKLRFPEFIDQWELPRLGEVLTLEYGSPLPEAARLGGPVPVVGSNGVVGSHSAKLIDGPAIIVGRKGSAGQVNWIEADCYPIDTTFYVRLADPATELRFIFALLQQSGIEKLRSEGAVPGLSRDSVHSLWLPLPNPLEQRKIAECLQSLEELIAAETEKLEALHRHKKGLLQQLFPAEGETIPRLRFSRYSNPWNRVALKEVLSEPPSYGLNAPATDYRADLPLYLRITDIDDEGRYVRAGRVSVARTVTSDAYLRQGDIAVARTGASVGKSYLVDGKDGPFVYAGFLIRLRADPGKLLPAFLAQWLFTDEYWRWVTLTSARSGQPGINGTEYASAAVPLPTGPLAIQEQLEVARCLSTVDTLIASQREKLDSLRTHKTALMQQLFPSLDEVDV